MSGVAASVLSTASIASGNGGNGKSMTNYRNKIIAILIVTAFYTTFLYQRGMSKKEKKITRLFANGIFGSCFAICLLRSLVRNPSVMMRIVSLSQQTSGLLSILK